MALHFHQVFLDRVGAVRPEAIAAIRGGAALRHGVRPVGVVVVMVVVTVVVFAGCAAPMVDRSRREPGRSRDGTVDHAAMILDEDVEGNGQMLREDAHTDGQAHPAQS